ncbi:hypothetical protein ACFL11_00335 [Patescibacteria group bacterium]
MEDISKKQSIFIQYFIWHFFEMPKNIIGAWQNFLLFNLNYFSIPLLFRTFLSPWRRYKWLYPRGFSFTEYAEVLLSNLISRVIGAIIRVFLIVIGLLVEISIFFVGIILLFGWLVLPAILIVGFLIGINIIF